MSMRKTTMARVTATLIAALTLVAATPQPALALDDNLWSQWVEEVTDRDTLEIPFAILFSLPAMIATTPFWLGEMAFAKLTEDE
jgi:hypothetical protein